MLKKMIDKLYSKEIKFVYSNQNNREDCIGQKSVIFDLQKAHAVGKVLKQAQQQNDEPVSADQFDPVMLGVSAKLNQSSKRQK